MTNKVPYKIGIVGIGAVGRPLKRYFEECRNLIRKESLFLYDTDSTKGFSDDISQADIIFVCVPTPADVDGTCDLAAVYTSINRLHSEKIVVIKSTVPPGTTETIQKKRPDLKLLFNPEFLTERQAWEDFIRPDRQIVGFTSKSFDAAQVVLALLPKAPFMSPWGINTYKTVRITATEAEIIKYANNIWFVRKVNLANAVALMCDNMNDQMDLPVVYEHIRAGLSADHRIGDSHLDVHHNGYKGWGGKCFPKDLLALISYFKKGGLKDCADLLESDLNFNIKLLESQNLSLEHVSLGLKYKHNKPG